MHIDHSLYDFIYRRASYPSWQRYRVNKLELKVLGMLSAYLKHINRVISSQQEFLDTVTRNALEKRKLGGAINGLVSKNCIGSFEYIQSPGSVCIGLSDLGVKVLSDFNTKLELMADKYKPSAYRIDNVINPSFTQEPNIKYKLKSA